MKKILKITYKYFKLGIWDNVEGIGPINWLFLKTLRYNNIQGKICQDLFWESVNKNFKIIELRLEKLTEIPIVSA